MHPIITEEIIMIKGFTKAIKSAAGGPYFLSTAYEIPQHADVATSIGMRPLKVR